MNWFNRRSFLIALICTVTMVLGGYVLFVYSGTRAIWELSELRSEHKQRQVEFSKLRSTGTALQVAQAKNEFELSQREVRMRCMQIAAENPGSRVEVASHLFVAKQWPETADADVAFDKLLQAAKNVDIGDWARSLEEIGAGSSERWRSLAVLLIERVRRQPDHPKAAGLLCRAAVAIHPDTDVKSAPPELHRIAELIHKNYATSPDLANFCEVVSDLGNPVGWSQPFEPHVRHILEVNQDRFVRCSAHFALASIVRSGGIGRQDEARQLYEDFLARFDGETEYRAQGIEQKNRQKARRVLETIRLHGLGAPAITTVGVDLEGRPMSLADYRGKIVLVSFWATWCGPCMRAIPHEKEILERFDPEQFAIVGVNGDKKPTVALEAVAEYGINWRSFQNKKQDGASIAGDWHIVGWPTFYLLDVEGVIERHWQGLPPQSELQAAIGNLVENADGREDSAPAAFQP
jgi:thiol-disulfide isomerase/thioredoxin